jgi:hypothetical protein
MSTPVAFCHRCAHGLICPKCQEARGLAQMQKVVREVYGTLRSMGLSHKEAMRTLREAAETLDDEAS